MYRALTAVKRLESGCGILVEKPFEWTTCCPACAAGVPAVLTSRAPRVASSSVGPPLLLVRLLVLSDVPAVFCGGGDGGDGEEKEKGEGGGGDAVEAPVVERVVAREALVGVVVIGATRG